MYRFVLIIDNNRFPSTTSLDFLTEKGSEVRRRYEFEFLKNRK
jgi:hypothetical protein